MVFRRAPLLLPRPEVEGVEDKEGLLAQRRRQPEAVVAVEQHLPPERLQVAGAAVEDRIRR